MTELINNIINDNQHAKVPQSVYSEYLKPIYESAYKAEYETVEFDPEVHLMYNQDEISKYKFENTRRLTMEELGLSNPKQISHIGVSDPFPLFTEEAIAIMKQEILSEKVFMEYGRFSYHTSGKDCCVRGHGKATPFTYAAWTHPKTNELISLMAGVELEVIMDCEVAHSNISMKKPDEVKEALANYKPKNLEEDCVVGWHNDSYPFVCVLMLSDTTNMIGGETSLRMGKGNDAKVVSVPGPTLGSAAVLQGRLIEHIAPNPLGVTERITMVTSYRPKDTKLVDTSVLNTVKPEINNGSRFNEFYPQWIKYRSDLIIDNLQQLNADIATEKVFDKKKAMEELKVLEKYLHKTYAEMEMTDEEWEFAGRIQATCASREL